MTDVLIVGAGTAGLTAAIYARRAGLSAEVLEQSIYGGQIITTTSIENYPGMPGVSGADFAVALHRQAQDLGAVISYESITAAQLSGDPKRITTAKGTREAGCVILATGARPRTLGCPGEERLTGRGVSYCATCDGAFHKGKDVAVVGGGNTAIEDALVLSGLCASVTVVHRRQQFRAERHALEQARSRGNIRFALDAEVAEIRGEVAVEALVLQSTAGGGQQTLPVSGVFIAIGAAPDNGLFSGEIALDEHGYIIAGEDCRTNRPGVFVAGDTRTKTVRQIVTAAADGAVAALGAVEYLAGLAR